MPVSDNGGEYMSEDFFQYCSDNGILRQMTCPNTPQQNGVSERKLAHLVSMSLSWLHDKNLPRELWAEAVQCACYVIIRLPPWPVQKTTIQEVTLDGDQENLQLCPENNMEVPIDDEFPASNISNSEDGEQRRSTRERRQPSYL
ncbi:hypothetical protein GH714_042035 [Hevea brasiliensis]|uniref:Integrase catalytic domain-containing protein n=1 Tax=Hevea brasiliensis TaxID=3981 RepID=A0A6A6MU49_HEVBR|nr:hypothetical protein GH714_042035 [Hevea brasiliensis]